MAPVPAVFVGASAIILFGFLAARFFNATRFPDIPILIGAGLLVGPVNAFLVTRGLGWPWLAELVTGDLVRPYYPYLSGLALVVILFDAGLRLDFLDLRRTIGAALLHTLPIFILTVLSMALVARYVFGMPIMLAVLLGVALSNVGQTVSLSLLRGLEMSPSVRSIYSVEMALYDLVSIPLIASILVIIEAGGLLATGTQATTILVRLLSLSLGIGFVSGLLWVLVLRRFQAQPYSYMVTFGALLAVYGVAQFLDVSGAVSVLVFGLVVGNRQLVEARLFKMKPKATVNEKVLEFHGEITFLVRSFFFLFLGLTFATPAAGDWVVESLLPGLRRYDHTAFLFYFGIVLLFVAIVASRFVGVYGLSAIRHRERRDLFLVYAHGLGTAVLASLPFTVKSYRPGTDYYDLFHPYESLFSNAALFIILLTIFSSSLGVFLHSRSHPRPPAPPSKPTAAPLQVPGQPASETHVAHALPGGPGTPPPSRPGPPSKP